ncbi:MAG TPA: hypothetical protein DDZ80_00830 [Cyanobacteria bacterium UBA8803]|nr:hypothetical protein [Cyanobacteria bacterium UBA9273]HBL57155.1 hypothetical protein [Cyanobacteria bacterium UBA8803]
MKLFKIALVVLVLLVNLIVAQPSWADKAKPKFTSNPDYIEITQALDKLLLADQSQEPMEGYATDEIQQQIANLEFQKYTLETGIDWGQCRNETGQTLAVYGPNRKKSGSSYENAIYFLADGQTTKNKWDCEGVYLPSDAKTTHEQGQDLTGAVAVKIVDGTQLVVTRNPETNTIEFNVPPAKVIKAGEVNWFIPDVPQASIASKVTNAPTIEAEED